MPDIRHRVGIASQPDKVFKALASTDGLSGWWTKDVKGSPGLGGKLEFSFGNPEHPTVMEVAEQKLNNKVVWRCLKGPDDWVGTRVTFEIKSSDKETIILFTHADWRQPVEFMNHCSTKWAYFLLGLKDMLENGKSHAYPNDLKISKWG